MRLALALGRANVDQMLRELTAEQFAEWCAFFGMEPWGFQEENRRVGVIASTVANFSGHAKRALSWRDFVPTAKAAPQSLVDRVKAMFGAPRKG